MARWESRVVGRTFLLDSGPDFLLVKKAKQSEARNAEALNQSEAGKCDPAEARSGGPGPRLPI